MGMAKKEQWFQDNASIVAILTRKISLPNVGNLLVEAVAKNIVKLRFIAEIWGIDFYGFTSPIPKNRAYEKNFGKANRNDVSMNLVWLFRLTACNVSRAFRGKRWTERGEPFGVLFPTVPGNFSERNRSAVASAEELISHHPRSGLVPSLNSWNFVFPRENSTNYFNYGTDFPIRRSLLVLE